MRFSTIASVAGLALSTAAIAQVSAKDPMVGTLLDTLA